MQDSREACLSCTTFRTRFQSPLPTLRLLLEVRLDRFTLAGRDFETRGTCAGSAEGSGQVMQ